ncbi:MAG: hypothetical protein Q4P06_04365 [Actinomycetaceae bacterium]|nr:hypothetical protein [Actinomycetaceae bacterium]
MAQRAWRLSAAAVAVAAFAVASLINDYLPGRDDILNRPFPRAAVVDEDVQLRTGSVRVSNVGVARAVEWNFSRAQTEEVFLTFSLTYLPNGEETTVGPVEVVDASGRIFGGTQAHGRSLRCGASQAGVAVTCDMAVEMPADALEDARLRVWNFNSGNGDDYADVALPLDADRVAALVSSAGDYTISPPTFSRSEK